MVCAEVKSAAACLKYFRILINLFTAVIKADFNILQSHCLISFYLILYYKKCQSQFGVFAVFSSAQCSKSLLDYSSKEIRDSITAPLVYYRNKLHSIPTALFPQTDIRSSCYSSPCVVGIMFSKGTWMLEMPGLRGFMVCSASGLMTSSL